MRRIVTALIPIVAVALVVSSSAATTHSWPEVVSPHVSGNSSEIDAMTATGTSDVWAFGFDRANIGGTFEWRVLGEHWDGNQWTRLNTLDRETAPAQDFIWGASATASNDVWIVGSSLVSSSDRRGRSLVEHWDGAHWSIDNSVPDPGLRGTLLAVSARTATDVWAVGEATFSGGADYNGYVVHHTPSGWVVVPFTPDVPGCNAKERGELDAVDAAGANDVYVAGWCQSQFPDGPSHGYVMHWNGAAWSLLLRAPSGSAFRELTTDPHGDVWVAGDESNGSNRFPLVFHGTVATGFTAVPVRHGANFGGNVDALSATKYGVVIAGQLTDPHGNPTATYALRLQPTGKWRKEPVIAIAGGYARAHAAAVEPGGTQWLGGTSVGGSNLDPQSLVARRD